MRVLSIVVGAVVVVAFGLAIGSFPNRGAEIASPIIARAPEAGIMAIASPGSGTVRVLFARNGSLVLVREIRLPKGESVTGLSVSTDGHDFLIDTQAVAYSISSGSWKLEPIAIVPGALLANAPSLR